jgi:hypothetical protein
MPSSKREGMVAASPAIVARDIDQGACSYQRDYYLVPTRTLDESASASNPLIISAIAA